MNTVFLDYAKMNIVDTVENEIIMGIVKPNEHIQHVNDEKYTPPIMVVSHSCP